MGPVINVTDVQIVTSILSKSTVRNLRDKYYDALITDTNSAYSTFSYDLSSFILAGLIGGLPGLLLGGSTILISMAQGKVSKPNDTEYQTFLKLYDYMNDNGFDKVKVKQRMEYHEIWDELGGKIAEGWIKDGYIEPLEVRHKDYGTWSKYPTSDSSTSDTYPGYPLVYGSTGSNVTKIQIRLNDLGFNCGTPDGSFGPATKSAVENFQRSRGLTVDGIVGPNTWNALFN